MAARRPRSTNNHLEEAMALLIHNQAAFVEQIARNDQERLVLQRRSDEREPKSEAWRREVDEWRLKSDKRFEKIEERLARIEADLFKLPKTIVQTILATKDQERDWIQSAEVEARQNGMRASFGNKEAALQGAAFCRIRKRGESKARHPEAR